ncbi:LysR family transcriptional regulator [Streptomyces sp. NPDC058657]|uniref:LysR family transcriptional regulator n=1 Tax=unclassified Streptomyces TaxID=2593676 RepID=UPI00364A14A3
MTPLEARELEAFLALAEELHFGRTAERLHLSQSRVSQLLRALESRVGARLVDRTSRRAALTPLGAQLYEAARPAYDALRTALDDARATARGTGTPLRIGFQGTANDHVMNALALFRRRHPDTPTELVEIPFGEPFGALRRHEVDTAAVLLPVEEPELVVGRVFSRRPQTLALPSHHPFARRARLSAEDLARCALIGVTGTHAPEYWRRAQAPTATPGGRAIAPGPRVNTLQEGLAQVQAGHGGMLLCRPSAAYYRHRALTFVPVEGLPDSVLGLVWHRSHETERTRAFADALGDTADETAAEGTGYGAAADGTGYGAAADCTRYGAAANGTRYGAAAVDGSAADL